MAKTNPTQLWGRLSDAIGENIALLRDLMDNNTRGALHYRPEERRRRAAALARKIERDRKRLMEKYGVEYPLSGRERELMAGALSARNPEGKHWIAKAIKRPGALHRALHVPRGEDIPQSKLRRAAKRRGRVGEEARLAETLESFHHHRNPKSVQLIRDELENVARSIEEARGRLEQAKYLARVVKPARKELGDEILAAESDIRNLQRYADKLQREADKLQRELALEKRRNPSIGISSAAEQLYDEFHGKEPTRIGLYDVPTAIPANVAELGQLLKIKLGGRGRMIYQLKFEPEEGVKLAADPESDSLHILGERQRLPDNCLSELEREYGDAARKNQFVLGTIKEITYRTKKAFDKFETIDYYHELGEETGNRPLLVYDRLNHRLLIVGGAYTVKPEGITN